MRRRETGKLAAVEGCLTWVADSASRITWAPLLNRRLELADNHAAETSLAIQRGSANAKNEDSKK
jgi:hypothetical protein